ncbi:MAG: hypothetical protein ACK5QO_00170, partial [Hyphomonadaceae bacterium]
MGYPFLERYSRFFSALLVKGCQPWGESGRSHQRRSRMAVDMNAPVLVVDDYQTMVRIIRNLL